MGYDPETQRMSVLNEQQLETFKQKTWPIFKEGEIVVVKPQVDMGSPFKAKFKIAELSENRMVLIALGA